MSPETSSEATALRNRISTRSGPRSPCIRRRAFRLRYSEVSATDKQALDAYLETLSNIQVQSLKPTEQFSYWINVYNALTVKTVLEHYPVKSIREISLGGSLIPSFITGGTGPWQAKLIQIDGESVALDDIEHRILRPLFKDNRIHYAVNCASIGWCRLHSPRQAYKLCSIAARAST